MRVDSCLMMVFYQNNFQHFIKLMCAILLIILHTPTVMMMMFIPSLNTNVCVGDNFNYSLYHPNMSVCMINDKKGICVIHCTSTVHWDWLYACVVRENVTFAVRFQSDHLNAYVQREEEKEGGREEEGETHRNVQAHTAAMGSFKGTKHDPQCKLL